MCWLVRCTVRRTASARAMRTRVLAARRCLEIFLSMSLPLELSGNPPSARAIAPLSDIARFHLFLLGFLQGDLLTRVAHALALVRLGSLVGADLGGHLAHPLAIHALDDDLGLRRRLGLHALGQRVHDGMREAEREVHLVALRLRPVA